MKRLAYFLCLLSLATSASAGVNSTTGFYLGGDVTFSTHKSVDGAAFDSSFLPISGYIRPFIGYRFNDFIAIESGYNDLVNDSHSGNDELGPDHYRLYAIDLAAKVIYPFENGFSIFGKLGGALTHQNVYNQQYTDWEPSADTNANRLLPLVGFGVSYNFTPQLATELTYMHLQGINPIGNIDIAGLGLSYTFGNS